MHISSDPMERAMFVADLQRKCLHTTSDRRAKYREWRQYYMYGTGPSDTYPVDGGFNKIYPHIDTLTSFLYAQDTTKFSVNLGASVSDIEYDRVPPLNRAVNDEWLNSNTDTCFGNALTWSFVYGSTFLKPRWKVDGIEPFVVDPHNFGVLREDAPELAQQEAYCHQYFMTKSQLYNELESCNHPQKNAIKSKVIEGPYQPSAERNGIGNIITSASSPLVIGNVNINLTNINLYVPRLAEELVQMTELYVYDDSISAMRIITLADPYVMIFDRPVDKVFLKDEAQYVQITPLPAYDYFWGYSEVERLIPLQRMRNLRMAQIHHMLELQAQPPKMASGFTASIDEMAITLDSPAGIVQNEMPGAKIEQLPPNIPDDLFAEVDRIDQMFEEASGIGNVLQGKGESGVRSTGHASQLLRSGSSRPKKRALIIEDSLEKVATLYLKMMAKYSDKEYKDDKGIKFTAKQFTEDFVVKVDAHSNSPIFTEDQTQLAFELVKVGAITKERLLDLLPIPMRDLMKQDLKSKIEPAEQAAKAAQQKQIEHEQQVQDKELQIKGLSLVKKTGGE